MDPITLSTLAAAGPAGWAVAGASAIGSIFQIGQGISARKQAELDAFNIETQRIMSLAEAKERSNQRLEQWRSNEATNIANFSAMGRDQSESMSVKAFLARQKEQAAKDVNTSDFMGYMESMKLRQEQGRALAEGRAAQTAGWIGGLTSIASGIYDFNQIR